MQLFRLPKVQMALVLLFLYAVVFPLLGVSLGILLLLLCVGFCVVFDVFFGYIKRRKFFVPYAAIVTGLILALIIEPTALWYQILIICGVAIGAKNFVRFGGRHIFNPAAFGIITGWIFFGLHPSWWGASLYTGGTMLLNGAIYLLLIAAAYVSTYRLRRIPVVASYLLIYGVLSFVVLGSSFNSVFQTMISPGVLFFALVMLPEPMTTPVVRNRQILYGIIIALLTIIGVFAVSRLQIANLPDFSILALLIANLLFFKFR